MLIMPMAKAMLAIAGSGAACFEAVSLTTRAIRGESTPSLSMTGCIPGRVGDQSIKAKKDRLSTLSTARGLYMRFSLVDPTKVKVCKCFTFTYKIQSVENKEHLFNCVFFLNIGEYLVKLSM